MKLLVVAALLCGSMFLTTASKSYRFNMSSGCPRGWTLFNQRCFVYVPQPLSWDDAEANCMSKGAHLASVHSSSEYHQLQKLTAPHGYKETWIGGTDREEENVWRWSDGNPFDYTHWCPGEPSDGENCLLINYPPSNCWNDVECGTQLPFICAKKRFNTPRLTLKHESPIKTQTDV